MTPGGACVATTTTFSAREGEQMSTDGKRDARLNEPVSTDRKRVGARRLECLFDEPGLREPSPDRWSQIGRVAMARPDHRATLPAKRRHGPNRRLDVAVG